MSTLVVMAESAKSIARTRPPLQLPLTTLNLLRFDINDRVRAMVDNEFQRRRLLEELAHFEDGDQSSSSTSSTQANSLCCCQECGRAFAREFINNVRKSASFGSPPGRKRKRASRTESDGLNGLEA